MAVVTHTMEVKSKQNENKTICHVPFGPLLSYSLCLSPGCCPRSSICTDNSMLLNYMYVMNNNNSSFTLEIMDYYYSCSKECNMNHKITLM